MIRPNPKPKKGVSDPIRESARGEDCALRLDCCNFNPETTSFAHLRFFNWAGIGQKVKDILGVYACSDCHDAIDGRSKASWGFDDLLRALGETLIKLHNKGLIKMKGADQ